VERMSRLCEKVYDEPSLPGEIANALHVLRRSIGDAGLED